MVYKIAYLEDQEAGSIKRNIEQQGFEVTHVLPQKSFEETLTQIQQINADLLLMDFRLHAGTAQFNAPPFAQFFRSQVIERGVSLPIVVISSEDNIRDYYRDYTSLDLFDFAINKETFLNKTKKYCSLFNELINGYQSLKNNQAIQGKKIGPEILNIPEELQLRIDSRLLDTLSMHKYQTDPFMMSGLLLSSFVKPVGILIGPDVLSARLGISKESPDWDNLLNQIDEFKYSGIYSKTYDRWWAHGIEIWWKLNFPSASTLRRLTASERCKLISEKYGLNQLIGLEKQPSSNSNRLWTICSGNSKPLDPVDGYEIAKDINNSPWLDSQYYSFDYLINAGLKVLEKLKEHELERYKDKLGRG
jgi:hypothetical protein